jgi:hypothetical protein
MRPFRCTHKSVQLLSRRGANRHALRWDLGQPDAIGFTARFGNLSTLAALHYHTYRWRRSLYRGSECTSGQRIQAYEIHLRSAHQAGSYRRAVRRCMGASERDSPTGAALAHGGKIVHLYIEMTGGCQGCASSQLTRFRRMPCSRNRKDRIKKPAQTKTDDGWRVTAQPVPRAEHDGAQTVKCLGFTGPRKQWVH